MAKKTKKQQKKQGMKKAKKAVKKQAPKAVSKAVSKATGPLVPLNDRVIIRSLTEAEAGTANKFGIIIPENASKEKQEQGIVVAAGPGRWDEDGERRIPMSVEVGDKVVFSKYGYDEVKVAGEEFFIVSEGNILAVIKD